MLEEIIWEVAEPADKGEKMVVVFKVGTWYAEKGVSRDKLKDEAAEAPDIGGIVHSSGKN